MKHYDFEIYVFINFEVVVEQKVTSKAPLKIKSYLLGPLLNMKELSGRFGFSSLVLFQGCRRFVRHEVSNYVFQALENAT